MTSLVRWEPFRELATLRGRMDRLFDDFNRTWGLDEGLTTGVWNPPVDVYETGDSIVLKAELPEVSEKDVDISIEDNTLTIRGERKQDKEIQEKNCYRMERSYGAFTRSFTLPPTVDPNGIEAKFAQGVLKVTLPKRPESKPKQIKVKVESDGK